MTLSTHSATKVVPLVARIILFLAFIWAGSNKLFSDPVTFEGDDARILEELGVGEPVQAVSLGISGRDVQKVRFPASRDDADDSGDVDPANDPGPADSNDLPPDDDPQDDPPPQPDIEPEADVEPEDVQPHPRVARPLHSITVRLVNNGWHIDWKPHWMAWLAALTEFAGAILLLVGLFSRIWALGLCIVMGFAFYMTSLPILMETFYFSIAVNQFNMMFAQLGLFALALAVLLVGPGPLSLDRLIFRRPDFDDE